MKVETIEVGSLDTPRRREVVEILATTILEMLVERTERVPRVQDRGDSRDRAKKP